VVHGLHGLLGLQELQGLQIAPCKQFAKDHGEPKSPERERYGTIYPWAEIAGKQQGAMIF
jgi:hypothetical protein